MTKDSEIGQGETEIRKREEFRFEALKLVTDRGVSVAQATRDLDLAEGILRRWVNLRALAAQQVRQTDGSSEGVSRDTDPGSVGAQR